MIRSPRFLFLSCLHTAVAVLLASPLLAQTPPFQSPEVLNADLQAIDPAQGDPLVDESGVEYLTHGPLHESYAEPYAADPKPTPVVPKEPPPPVKELPPTLRPESDKSTWIPGYWDWDEELGDYLWISGVWREVPPQRRWVPGYWEPAEDGYRRVAGFWANEQAATVDYLPPPPESLEQGPASPAPGDNYFYVPGNWNYQTSQYQWTPGFWARCQPNWVWIPNQYVWTPRGCIFRSGYWDYRLQRRGVLFTPVYYRSPIYLRANYWYRPRYVINSGLGLLANLFVNPRYGRYYFGDYYGVGYGTSFYPWISYYQRPRLYDPLYSYYGIRSLHDREPSLDRIARQHQQIRQHQELRPPRTYAGQLAPAGQRGGPPTGKGNRERAEMANLANPLEDYARRNSDDIRFRRISDTQASSLGRFAEQSQEKTRSARRDFEQLPPGKKVDDASVAARSGMPRGPSRVSSFRLPVDEVPQRGAPSSIRGRDVLNNDIRGNDIRGNDIRGNDIRGNGRGDRTPMIERSSPPVRQFGSPRGSELTPSSGFGRSTNRDVPNIRSVPDLRSSPQGRSIPQSRSYTPRQSSSPTINRGDFGSRSDFGDRGGLKASGGRGNDGGLKASGGGFGSRGSSGDRGNRGDRGSSGGRGNSGAGSGGGGSKGKARGK